LAGIAHDGGERRKQHKKVERFFGVLLEHYVGAFPAWLAPIQLVILNITDKQAEYSKKVVDILKNKGFRVNSDLRNEKIGFKIREHTLQKIPYLLVVGDREVEEQTVAVRVRGGEDSGAIPLTDFIEKLTNDVVHRGLII